MGVQDQTRDIDKADTIARYIVEEMQKILELVGINRTKVTVSSVNTNDPIIYIHNEIALLKLEPVCLKPIGRYGDEWERVSLGSKGKKLEYSWATLQPISNLDL